MPAEFEKATKVESLSVQIDQRLFDGVAWAEKGDHGKAAACFEQALHLMRGRDVPELQGVAAQLLVNYSIALGELGNFEEALATCNEFLAKFRGAASPRQVSDGLQSKGVTLYQLDRFAEAIGCYDEALALLDKQTDASADETYGETIAQLLVNKIITLGALDDSRTVLV